MVNNHHHHRHHLILMLVIPLNGGGRIYPTLTAISPTPTLHLTRFKASSFSKPILRPCPHVSGYFWIHKISFPDWKVLHPHVSGYDLNQPVHTYPDSLVSRTPLWIMFDRACAVADLLHLWQQVCVCVEQHEVLCLLRVQIFHFITCNMPQQRQNTQKNDKSKPDCIIWTDDKVKFLLKFV